jgi:hypothetical protein
MKSGKPFHESFGNQGSPQEILGLREKTSGALHPTLLPASRTEARGGLASPADAVALLFIFRFTQRARLADNSGRRNGTESTWLEAGMR